MIFVFIFYASMQLPLPFLFYTTSFKNLFYGPIVFLNSGNKV